MLVSLILLVIPLSYPSMRWVRGGLNFHLLFLEFKLCFILLLSSLLTMALSSDCSPIKLLILSDVIISTCPFVAINRLRANINYSVVRSSATSRCNFLIVKQTKITPYRLLNAGFSLVYFVALTFTGSIVNPCWRKRFYIVIRPFFGKFPVQGTFDLTNCRGKQVQSDYNFFHMSSTCYSPEMFLQ